MSESNQLEPISPLLTTRIDYRKAGEHPVAVYLEYPWNLLYKLPNLRGLEQ